MRSSKITRIVLFIIFFGLLGAMIYSRLSYTNKRKLLDWLGIRDIKLPSSSSLFPVRPDGETKGQWGYMDGTGELVILPGFEKAAPFSEGLGCVAVYVEGGGILYGFIDSSGAFVIPPQFTDARSFHDGLALVCTNSGRTDGVFIDKSGKRVMGGNLHMQWTTDFLKGKASVYARGPMRKNHPDFVDHLVTVFTLGLARPPDSTYDVEQMIVDHRGRILLTEDSVVMRTDAYGDMVDYSEWSMDSVHYRIEFEGYASRLPYVDTETHKVGYVKVPWEAWWRSVERVEKVYHNELAAKLPACIPPQFDFGGYFENGIAPVKLNGESVFIDTLGNVVCRFRK